MAREVVVSLWCDKHLADHDVRVDGVTREVEVEGRRYTLDLCDDCADRLIAPLARFAYDHGVAVGEKRRTRAPADQTQPVYPCPVCGAERRGRAAMRAHFKTDHDQSLAEWEGQNGTSIEGDPLPFKCPECDGGFATPQGMGAHRAKIHDVSGTRH